MNVRTSKILVGVLIYSGFAMGSSRTLFTPNELKKMIVPAVVAAFDRSCVNDELCQRIARFAEATLDELTPNKKAVYDKRAMQAAVMDCLYKFVLAEVEDIYQSTAKKTKVYASIDPIEMRAMKALIAVYVKQQFEHQRQGRTFIPKGSMKAYTRQELEAMVTTMLDRMIHYNMVSRFLAMLQN